MCLGIPMRIVAIDGHFGRCEAKGAERRVNLFMLQHESLMPGDFVMVQAGTAMGRMTAEEAQLAWDAYDEILALQEAEQASAR